MIQEFNLWHTQFKSHVLNELINYHVSFYLMKKCYYCEMLEAGQAKQ